ncbi:RHS repeat protein [Salmonella enterica subsp. salamae]|nr:RHS repeat protein [Salmonella enterica]EBP4573967.1 RHS repeat protein [Salmonella enterica]ECJ5917666.1 RHS repeat protein [Salmonella enterica subsp. salamae]ECW0043135.1 RHS repeat protein [Salmonella enterica]
MYLPGPLTLLVRIETETSELSKAARRTLAEKFQQDAGMAFVPELVTMVDNLEAELQRGELSEANRTWLAQCGLTPEQIQNQMEPEYIPQRKIHLYHCDHRGLPLALVNAEGKADWSAEYDAWGNVQRENNPHNMKQLIRLPGQQCDEETGLYYNRHRYYDPLQGRYITQDPIGLRGGWNLYKYPLNPMNRIDPLGLIDFPGYNTPRGNGVGSVPNAVSEGRMSYDEGIQTLKDLSGPHYSPPLFSISLDGGLSGYGIAGGSVAVGVLTGNGDKGLDLCTYIMSCEGAGIGAAGGASISGTVTNAPPSSGSSYYKGATTDVGLVANGAVTVLSEINGKEDPTHISATLSGGIGGGGFTGVVTCQQYTKCIVN